MGTVDFGRIRRPRVGLLAVQGAAVLVAAAFLVAAIAGFIPGLTTHLDHLHWLGHESQARLFGVFEVSVLHNLLHLTFGVTGLLLSRTFARARAYLMAAGWSTSGCGSTGCSSTWPVRETCCRSTMPTTGCTSRSVW